MSITDVFNPPKDLIALRDEWLRKRGLEVSDFPDKTLTVTSSIELLGKLGVNIELAKGRPYIVLPFRNTKGDYYQEENQIEENANPAFSQVRFLGVPEPRFLRDGKEAVKIATPSGRLEVHFQLPPGADYTWDTLPPGQPIIIVESMPKAMKVSKEICCPTIGLCGVNSYSASKQGREFILNEHGLDLRDHPITILFDANWASPGKTGENIRGAQDLLAWKLKYIMGVKSIFIAKLPPTDGDYKAGPDDFLVAYGDAALAKVLQEAEEYKGDPNDALVNKMNDRAFYIKNRVKVVDRQSKVVMKYTDAAFHFKNICKNVPNKAGKIVTTFGFDEWSKSENQARVDDIGYEYLGPEIFERDGQVLYNTYRQSGIWPNGPVNKAAAAKVIEFLKGLLGAKYEFVMAQLKFVKFTNRRPNTMTAFVSTKQGVGKSFLLQLARNIVGPGNAGTITNTVIQERFNSPFDAKRLVTMEEVRVSGQKRAEVVAKLKEIVGNDQITVERKGIDAEDHNSSIMLWFSSNTRDELPIDGKNDRRMDVIECITIPEAFYENGDSIPEYWAPIKAGINDPDTLRGVLDEIVNMPDIDFDARHADYDEAKLGVIESNRQPVLLALDQVVSDLKLRGVTCVDSSSLHQLVIREMGTERIPPAKALGKMISADGYSYSEGQHRLGLDDVGGPRKVLIVDKERFIENGDHIRENVHKAREIALGKDKY